MPQCQPRPQSEWTAAHAHATGSRWTRYHRRIHGRVAKPPVNCARANLAATVCYRGINVLRLPPPPLTWRHSTTDPKVFDEQGSPTTPRGNRPAIAPTCCAIASLILSTDGDSDPKYSPNFWLSVTICSSVSAASPLGVTLRPTTSQTTSQHSCADASSNGTGGLTDSPKVSPIACSKSVRNSLL